MATPREANISQDLFYDVVSEPASLQNTGMEELEKVITEGDAGRIRDTFLDICKLIPEASNLAISRLLLKHVHVGSHLSEKRCFYEIETLKERDQRESQEKRLCKWTGPEDSKTCIYCKKDYREFFFGVSAPAPPYMLCHHPENPERQHKPESDKTEPAKSESTTAKPVSTVSARTEPTTSESTTTKTSTTETVTTETVTTKTTTTKLGTTETITSETTTTKTTTTETTTTETTTTKTTTTKSATTEPAALPSRKEED